MEEKLFDVVSQFKPEVEIRMKLPFIPHNAISSSRDSSRKFVMLLFSLSILISNFMIESFPPINSRLTYFV